MTHTHPLDIKIIGQGAPLILLHGWGWNSRIWEPLLPKLIPYYQLFLIDLPGCGKSPDLTNYYFENILTELSKITPAHATWLGWSLGGLLATGMAIHFPERVTKLITITSSPRFVQDTNWPGLKITHLQKFSELLRYDTKKTLQDFLALQLRGSPKQDELISALQIQLFCQNQTSLSALLGGLKLLCETDLRSDLKKIACPSLHIFGQLDTIVPNNIINILSPLMPKGRFEIIKRAGHIPFLSQQDIFLDLLNQFLG